MDSDGFVKKLSKFSKEVILKTVYDKTFFNKDEFARELQWNDMQGRFDKLMKQDEEIRKKMEQLINKKDFKSFTEYVSLMGKSDDINKKVDAVMKEMSAHNRVYE